MVTNRFGGPWTELKLAALADYVHRYNIALKNHPYFERWFIDGFAGTGYVDKREIPDTGDSAVQLGLPTLDLAPVGRRLDGSARIALSAEIPFDHYLLIEEKLRRSGQLADMRSDFPDLDVDIECTDANAKIQEICSDWPTNRRALVFLDPYGNQVDFNTLKALAKTKATDVWYLFPSGLGVNWQAARSGNISPKTRASINRVWGNESWYDLLYRTETINGLFGTQNQVQKVASSRVIELGFIERLRLLFAEVADVPLSLQNSTGTTMFSLVFAAANEKGAPIARRIAEGVIKRIKKDFSNAYRY